MSAKVDEDVMLTVNHIWILWESEEVHYESNELNARYYKGEIYDYDFVWAVPSYAPEGKYWVFLQIMGEVIEEDDEGS